MKRRQSQSLSHTSGFVILSSSSWWWCWRFAATTTTIVLMIIIIMIDVIQAKIIKDQSSTLIVQMQSSSNYRPYSIVFLPPNGTNDNKSFTTWEELETGDNTTTCLNEFIYIRGLLYNIYSSTLLVETKFTTNTITSFDTDNQLKGSTLFYATAGILDGEIDDSVIRVVQTPVPAVLTAPVTPTTTTPPPPPIAIRFLVTTPAPVPSPSPSTPSGLLSRWWRLLQDRWKGMWRWITSLLSPTPPIVDPPTMTPTIAPTYQEQDGQIISTSNKIPPQAFKNDTNDPEKVTIFMEVIDNHTTTNATAPIPSMPVPIIPIPVPAPALLPPSIASSPVLLSILQATPPMYVPTMITALSNPIVTPTNVDVWLPVITPTSLASLPTKLTPTVLQILSSPTLDLVTLIAILTTVRRLQSIEPYETQELQGILQQLILQQQQQENIDGVDDDDHANRKLMEQHVITQYQHLLDLEQQRQQQQQQPPPPSQTTMIMEDHTHHYPDYHHNNHDDDRDHNHDYHQHNHDNIVVTAASTTVATRTSTIRDVDVSDDQVEYGNDDIEQEQQRRHTKMMMTFEHEKEEQLSSSSSLSLSNTTITQQQQQNNHRRLGLCRRTVCYQSKYYINLSGCSRYCSTLRRHRRRNRSLQPLLRKKFPKGKKGDITTGRGDITAAIFYQYVQQFLLPGQPCRDFLLNMTYVTIDLTVRT